MRITFTQIKEIAKKKSRFKPRTSVFPHSIKLKLTSKRVAWFLKIFKT